MSLRIFSSRTLISLVVVILLAAFLRFYNLEKWGPIFYDEGQYRSEAIYVRDILVWSKDLALHLPFSQDKASLIDHSVRNFRSTGKALKTGRPLHNVVMAFGALLFPFSMNWGNYISAIFGTLNVFLTFFLALIITKSNKIALLSAFILALMPSHVFYSRLTMAEMDSQFFFLISLILYMRRISTGKVVYWYFTSIFTALALITNGDRFAFVTPILAELIIYRQRAIKQLIIFSVVMISVFILCEAPYHFAFLLTHNYNINVSNPSYLEQELWIFARLFGFGTKLNLSSLLSYPFMIYETTGPIFILLLVIGFIAIFRLKNKLRPIVIITIFSTLFFQSFHSLQALRAISPILPLLATATAIGFNYFSEILRGKITNIIVCRMLITGLLLLLFKELLVGTSPLLNYYSPYNKAVNYLNNHQSKSIVTTGDVIFESINPNLDTINYQNTFGNQNLILRTQKNPDYIVTTVQKFTISTKAINLTKKLDPTTLAVEEKCLPEYSIDDINSPILLKFFAYEHNSSIQKSINFVDSFNDLNDSRVNIYSYKNCLQELTFNK